MTTATLTSSHRRAARAAGPARGPRLLLPPVCEPSGVLPEGTHLLPPALRSVRSPATDDGWPSPRPARPAPPRPPDPAGVCGPVVLAAVEALAGSRPVTQLVGWVTPTVYDALAERVPSGSPSGPVRRATVRRSRVCRLSSTVAEASVVVHDGSRVRAAALRLEVRRGRWRATALQIG